MSEEEKDPPMSSTLSDSNTIIVGVPSESAIINNQSTSAVADLADKVGRLEAMITQLTLAMQQQPHQPAQQQQALPQQQQPSEPIYEHISHFRQPQSKPASRVDIQPFWENDPEGWSKQVEAAFLAAHVFDEKDKYFKIISCLPKSVIDNIKSTIELSEFQTGKLKTLLDRLIVNYKPSKSVRREKLLARKSLEGLKPSQAWFWAVSTAGDIYSKSELLTHWIKWIPESIAVTIEQQVIELEKRLENSAGDNLILDNLQLMITTTDLLIERHPDKSNSVSVVNKNSRSSSFNNQNRFRNRSRSRGRSNYRNNNFSNGSWCFIHQKYRNDARKCADPANCTFRHNNRQPRQQHQQLQQQHSQQGSSSMPRRSSNRVAASSTSNDPNDLPSTSTTSSICHPPNQNRTPKLSRENRMFVVDYISSRKIMIDSGSQISIWPAGGRDKCKTTENKDNIKLFAHNGTTINTYGVEYFKINIGFKHDFIFNFVIADSNVPLIGIDFLSHFNIVADFKNMCLFRGSTNEQIFASTCSSSIYSVSAISDSVDARIKSLLNKFPDITNPNLAADPKHHVQHHIILTTDRPVNCLPVRLDPIKMQLVRQEINLLIDQKILSPSSSPYASRIVVVPKPNGRVRVCGDYRALNAITQPDRYPMRHIHDFSQYLNGCKIFSTIDLLSAFHQIPVAENDRHKTAIITPLGLFQYNRLPFGLRNAPSTFQRFIDGALRDLDFVFAYQDDILVASKDDKEHSLHLHRLFEQLSNFGLKINVDKSVFFRQQVKFLGHNVTADGICILDEKLTAINDYPLPSSNKSLKRFLGMINFYRRFIPHATKFLAILYDMEKSDGEFSWNDEQTTAFNGIKQLLAKKIKLAFFNPRSKLILKADASGVGVGGVLEQLNNDGSIQPLGFFSRKLKDSELILPVFDKELLALFLSIHHFEYLLEGRKFTVFTDHRPLVSALLTKNNTKRNPVQLRKMAYILQFTVDIKFIDGSQNTVADALSRVNLDSIYHQSSSTSSSLSSSIENHLSIETIINEQKHNQNEMNEYLNNYGDKICKHHTDHGILLVHVEGNLVRPIIPRSLSSRIIKLCHGIAHHSSNRTTNIVSNRYYWMGMNKDVKEFCRNCIDCQQSKIDKHIVIPPQQIEIPKGRFVHVNMDIVGPLPVTKCSGNRYLLTCIDRFSRWPEAWPIPDITTETVARKFVEEWVSRFGIPAKITTDRGPQFQADLYRKFADLLGVQLISTSAYNPRANGMIERFHRSLKSAIKASCGNWEEVLPLVLLGLRTIVREDLQSSSAELLYGEPITIPADLLTNTPNDEIVTVNFVDKLRTKMNLAKSTLSRPKSESKIFVPPDLAKSKFVFVRKENKRSLDRPYTGPYEVLQRYNHSYLLMGKNKPFDVSISRLKPAYIEQKSPDSSNQPVKRVKFSRFGRLLKPPNRLTYQ